MAPLGTGSRLWPSRIRRRGLESPAMAYVEEIESKFVGMFFLVRRVVREVGGGFRYILPSGGATALKVRNQKSSG